MAAAPLDTRWRAVTPPTAATAVAFTSVPIFPETSGRYPPRMSDWPSRCELKQTDHLNIVAGWWVLFPFNSI